MSDKPEGLGVIIKILGPSKQKIAIRWMRSPSVIEIFAKHKISREKFRPLFAEKVIQYFIDVLTGVKSVGQCPVMNKFIDYMSDKELSVKEIFLICMAFRRSMFDHLIANGQLLSRDTTILAFLSEVFDKNLSGVLDYFSQQDITRETEALYEHDQEHYIKSVQTILDLQEQMILILKEKEVMVANRAFLNAFGSSSTKAFDALFPDRLSFMTSMEYDGMTYDDREDLDVMLTKVADSVDQVATIHLLDLRSKSSHPYRGKISRLPDDEKDTLVIVLDELEECDERIVELSRYAYEDTLTGLHNRRKFDESMDSLLGQCQNSDIGLTMIMLDLSDIRHIYEMSGREKGDQVIIQVAQEIQARSEKLGPLARIEDERFALLLKASTSEQARSSAEALQTSIHQLDLDHPVMCDIAVVVCQKDDTKLSMLSRADMLIQESIRHGDYVIRDDLDMVQKEQERQEKEAVFLRACIEMKAADKTLDVVNYYEEVPIRSASLVIAVKRGTLTVAVRKIALNALQKEALVYIQNAPSDEDIQAHVKAIDHEKSTITIDRFKFVRSSPLDRTSIRVKVEEETLCFIKMGNTQIEGTVESISAKTATIVLPHIYGISKEDEMLLDMWLRWDGREEHLQLLGKMDKVLEQEKKFRLIMKFDADRVLEDVVVPYIASRQLEIIKTLQHAAL